MKKAALISLFLCSSSALAAPYVGVQYGIANVSTDETMVFVDDQVSLTPDSSSETFGAFVGYHISDTFALEFGYNHYQVDQSKEIFNGIVSHNFGGQTLDALHETEWDADMVSDQLYIMPTWSHTMNDKWQLTLGLGLTYSQYRFDGHSTNEFEAIINDDIEQSVLRSTLGESKADALGGIAKVGVNYFIVPQWQVGLSAHYQADNIASVTQLALATSYHF